MNAWETSANPDVTIHYADNDGSSFIEGSSDWVLNGTTPVDILSAPSTGTRRIVKSISICNKDTVANTITIDYNNNGTIRRIAEVLLDVGDTWTLDGTYTSTWAKKTSGGGAGGDMDSSVYDPANISEQLVGISEAQTVENKRIAPRVTTQVSSDEPTINTDGCDIHYISELAEDITSMTTNLTGTPLDFEELKVIINDDGTPRAIEWGAEFESAGVDLPTTTIANTPQTVGLIRNNDRSKWWCILCVPPATDPGPPLPVGMVADILVVGWGGSGSDGGWGAGKYFYTTSFDLVADAYNVIIGRGGYGTTDGDTNWESGYNSVFGGGIFATGGGYGAGRWNNGGPGASGGGGWSNSTGGGTASAGFAGWMWSANAWWGGGWASSAGDPGLGSRGGDGGEGFESSISGSLVGYCGWGGGGSNTIWLQGIAVHWGWSGGANVRGSHATANTGGGGGGWDLYSGWGHGGSGVVIVRYVTASFGACSGGTITTDGLYTVHKFTSDGIFTSVSL